ncbi:hypothetical protein [Nocardia sp. NRRL S-836]|uniref:hypothetical protein n=1 Tax=Nocardia sp. NRRL S-836 TaxID=1519492 RepID=UPI0009EAA48F
MGTRATTAISPFARHLPSARLLTQLDLWEDEVRRTLAYCAALLEEEAADLPRALTVRFAIRRAESDLAWLQEARAELTDRV